MNIVKIYQQFPSREHCFKHLEKVKWDNNPECPYCKSHKHTKEKTAHRYHCNNCNTSYRVTVGTIFHKTKLDLQKWFLAIALVINAKKGISARQLARDIEVNKNTAWYLLMRLREAMLDDSDLLKGVIEMDETYVGGKPRKGKNTKDINISRRGRGTKKIPVVGMIERGGKVKAKVVKKVNSSQLRKLVRRDINLPESTLITDQFKGYLNVSRIVEHKVINHSKSYCDGEIHTNSIEGFWSLLKRGIVGQYHKVSLRHLQKYVNEFTFRHNNRKNEDVFNLIISNALGV